MLAAEGQPMTARQIADRLRVPLSSTYRYLGVLADFGLARPVGNSGHYALGPKTVSLWVSFRRSFDLAAVARPCMVDLARETEETVLLTVVVQNRAVAIEAVDSPLPIHYSFRLGVERPLYAGASAKALLAFLDEPQIEEVLAEARREAPHLCGGLREAIRRIRADGYAVSEGEVDPGACAVGVPIFGEGNVLEGALSVVAPSYRTGPDRLQFLIGKTVQAAREIERRLRAPVGGVARKGQERRGAL